MSTGKIYMRNLEGNEDTNVSKQRKKLYTYFEFLILQNASDTSVQ